MVPDKTSIKTRSNRIHNGQHPKIHKTPNVSKRFNAPINNSVLSLQAKIQKADGLDKPNKTNKLIRGLL